MPAQDCRVYENYFVTAAPVIEAKIKMIERMIPDPFQNGIRFGTWVDGRGLVHTGIQYQPIEQLQALREIPDVASTLSDRSLVCGTDGGVCINPTETIRMGSREFQYTLKTESIRTTDICLETIRNDHSLAEQVDAYSYNLAKQTVDRWKIIKRENYLYFGHKVIANSALTTNTAFGMYNFPVDPGTGMPPTSGLTISMLNALSVNMFRAGATIGAYMFDGAVPIWMLSIGQEATDTLLATCGTCPSIDFRYADPEMNIKGLGTSRVYKNYNFQPTPYPLRFTWSPATGYESVNPFELSTNTTFGVSTPQTQTFEDAPFEVAQILNSEVLEIQVPVGNVSGTGSMQFRPQDYRGTFQWYNILNECTNPDGTIGFYKAIFKYAPKPLNPQFAKNILYRRMDCVEEITVACPRDMVASGPLPVTEDVNCPPCPAVPTPSLFNCTAFTGTIPTGYFSAITLTDADGLTLTAGDSLSLTLLDGSVIHGVVIAYADPTLDIAFLLGNVTCDTFGDLIVGILERECDYVVTTSNTAATITAVTTASGALVLAGLPYTIDATDAALMETEINAALAGNGTATATFNATGTTAGGPEIVLDIVGTTRVFTTLTDNVATVNFAQNDCVNP